MSLAAGQVFAGYTVVRLLGSDGMGEVYLAKHPALARQDALRVLPAALSSDGEFRAHFEREAAVAATLWHPHVVGVHGHGEHLGHLWIATDFVDAQDAATLIREHQPNGMSPEDAVDVVTAIADALDYARGRHLLHHDVTPANVLLTPLPNRRILLTGFGIPHLSGELDDRTAINVAVGVPRPETDDGREDQYDLAATAHHLLSGTPRFAHPLGHTRADLAAFDPALVRALAKDPAERFDTCLDFARALRDGLAGMAGTVASPILRTDEPTAMIGGFATGPGQPAFVPAWSEEPAPNPYLDPEPDPSFSPTMTAMPVPPTPPQHHSGPTGRTWAMAAVAAVVVVVIGVVVLLARDEAEPSAQPTSPQPSTSGPPPPPETTAAPGTAADGRVAPPPVDGPDGVGESCRDGYQITGQDGWASHAGRGNPAATCVFAGNVLKAYWDAADPADAPRTIVAAGAIPCSDGAECSGEAFVVTCAVEGPDPWVTCRGGRGAVVYLY